MSNGRKIIQQKEVSVSIIKDNDVLKGSTFFINRFTYLFKFGQNQKVNLSLFLKTQNEFQVIKHITIQNMESFAKRKMVSVLNTEHNG